MPFWPAFFRENMCVDVFAISQKTLYSVRRFIRYAADFGTSDFRRTCGCAKRVGRCPPSPRQDALRLFMGILVANSHAPSGPMGIGSLQSAMQISSCLQYVENPISTKVYHTFFPHTSSRKTGTAWDSGIFVAFSGSAVSRLLADTAKYTASSSARSLAPAEQPLANMRAIGSKSLRTAKRADRTGQQMVLPQVPRQIARVSRRQGRAGNS